MKYKKPVHKPFYKMYTKDTLRDITISDLDWFDKNYDTYKDWDSNTLYLRNKRKKPIPYIYKKTTTLRFTTRKMKLSERLVKSKRAWVFLGLFYAFLGFYVYLDFLNPDYISPINNEVTKTINLHIEPAVAKTEDTSSLTVEQMKAISIIRAFNGKADPVLALAVSMGEGFRSNGENRGEAKRLKNGKWYSGECSIGLLQINLRKNACKGDYVHWDKVPGETLNDKIEWLKDFDNNANLGATIFEDWGGFKPWSSYTSGSYKIHLNEAKVLYDSVKDLI